LGTAPALVANLTDYVHDPHETESLPLEAGDIPYRWKVDR
jgi:hypothetical protein